MEEVLAPTLRTPHVSGRRGQPFPFRRLCSSPPSPPKVTVEDPFVRKHHQLLNFVRFCELCRLHGVVRVDLVTGLDEDLAVQK